MSDFRERLQAAAKWAGSEEHQAGIAEALGVGRQTVNRWFMGSAQPNAEMLLQIARTFRVDAEWLQSGSGEMLPKPSNDGLLQDERELVKYYRSATPQVRKVISQMVRAVRKSVVTIAAVIPPLVVPAPSDASVLHNSNYSTVARAEYALHVIARRLRRWLRALMLVTPFAISACATRAPDVVSVRWVRIAQEEIHRVCAKQHGAGAIVLGHYRGCSTWNRDAGVCTIWAADFPEVKQREQMATLGHELKHCFDGPWH